MGNYQFKICNKFILLVIFILTLVASTAHGYGNSEYEYQHIYPQQYFNRAGDSYTFKLKEYEHRWVHVSGGYDSDWEAVDEKIPFLAKLFGINYLKDDDGSVSLFAKKNAAIIAGARHITYAFVLYDYRSRDITMLTAMHFDGVSNILYNGTYILSIPAKIIHFTSECFKRGTGLFNGDKSVYGLAAAGWMFLWMLWETIIGLIFAIVMIPVGAIIGTLCHPFQTLANLTISFSDPFTNNILSTALYTLFAVLKSIIIIFFW